MKNGVPGSDSTGGSATSGLPTVRFAVPADLPAVERLLAEAKLPLAGVAESVLTFVVAAHRDAIVGVAGLEVRSDNALLRSVAVAPEWRNRGLGRALVSRAIAEAERRRLQALYLLTTTAAHYFPTFGFEVTTRDAVPADVWETQEFQSACPESSIVMVRRTPCTGEPTRELRLLFLCTGNSARSQMAEALLNHKGKGRFHAESAGSQPATRVNPYAIETLRRTGVTWAGHAPRGMDGPEQESWDFVITVCDRAKEACPLFAGQPIIAHWGMDDPAEVGGSSEEKQRAFDQAFFTLARRIDLLLALPIEKLQRLALESRVRAIGTDAPAAFDP